MAGSALKRIAPCLVGLPFFFSCSAKDDQPREPAPFVFHLSESYFYDRELPVIPRITRTIYDLDPAAERITRERPFEKIDELVLNPGTKAEFDPESAGVRPQLRASVSARRFSFRGDEFVADYAFDQRDWIKKYPQPSFHPVSFGNILVTKSRFELKVFDMSEKGAGKEWRWTPPGDNGERKYWTLMPPHQNTEGRELLREGGNLIYADLAGCFYKLSVLSENAVQSVWEHPLGNWSLITRPILIKNQVLLNLINSKMQVVLLVLDKTDGSILKTYFLGVTSFLSPVSAASLRGKEWVFIGTHHGFSYLYSAPEMALKWIRPYPAKNYDLFYYWRNFNTARRGQVPLDGEALWGSDPRRSRTIYYKSYESPRLQALNFETGRIVGEWPNPVGELCLGGLDSTSYWLDKNNGIFARDLERNTKKLIASLPAGDFRGGRVSGDAILVKIGDTVYSAEIKGTGKRASKLIKTQYPADWLLEMDGGSELVVGGLQGLAVYGHQDARTTGVQPSIPAKSGKHGDIKGDGKKGGINKRSSRITGFALTLVPLKGADSDRKDFLLAAGDELMLVDKGSGNIKWSRRFLRNACFMPPAGPRDERLFKRVGVSAKLSVKKGREILLVEDEANILTIDKESGELLESSMIHDPTVAPPPPSDLAALQNGDRIYRFTENHDLLVEDKKGGEKKSFRRNLSIRGREAGVPKLLPWGTGAVLFAYEHLWWIRDLSRPIRADPLAPAKNYFFAGTADGGFVAAHADTGIFFYTGPGKFTKTAWKIEARGEIKRLWEAADGYWFFAKDRNSFYFVPKPGAPASLKQRAVSLEGADPFLVTAATYGNDLWAIISTALVSERIDWATEMFDVGNRLVKFTPEGQIIQVEELPYVANQFAINLSGTPEIEVDGDSYRWSVGNRILGTMKKGAY